MSVVPGEQYERGNIENGEIRETIISGQLVMFKGRWRLLVACGRADLRPTQLYVIPRTEKEAQGGGAGPERGGERTWESRGRPKCFVTPHRRGEDALVG